MASKRRRDFCPNIKISNKENSKMGSSKAQWLAYSLLDRASPSLIPSPSIPEILSDLINGAAERKVESGLKMFI